MAFLGSLTPARLWGYTLALHQRLLVKCELVHTWSGAPAPRVPAGLLNTLLTTTGVGVLLLKLERSAQSRHKTDLRRSRSRTPEGVMSEVEFDLLLDAVRTAVAPISGEDFLTQTSPRLQPLPRAANDNRAAWPLVPFPEGWYAAC